MDELEPTTPPTPPTGFIDSEGVLQEGWKETLLDEDMRSMKIFDNVKDVKGALSILGNQAKLVGKKGYILPTELSDEKEWNEFYKTMGRPETPDDYQMPIPEEYKDYYDDEMVKNAQRVFHKIGLYPKQANELWEFEKQRVVALDKAIAEQEEQYKLESDSRLKTKWGTAYQENMHIADRVISENIEPERLQDFLKKYGNNPDIIEVLATVGKKFVEHKVINEILPSDTTDKRIDELMGKNLPTEQQMKLPYWDRTHANHKATVQMVQNLMMEQAQRKGTTP